MLRAIILIALLVNNSLDKYLQGNDEREERNEYVTRITYETNNEIDTTLAYH